MDLTAIVSGVSFSVGAIAVAALTLVAGIAHAFVGHVDRELLAAPLVGSIPGIWIGAKLTRRMPEALVPLLLCAPLVTAGVEVIH